MSPCNSRTKSCGGASPTNGSSQCNIKPSYGGGTIIPSSPIIEDIFLIDEFLSFIVTEASAKIIVGERQVGGKFAASIKQIPQQGGSVKQRV